jgi:crotonobetainyl-CoA:carnitine CoA-transferase CaiB-like acyl-CoA transferase
LKTGPGIADSITGLYWVVGILSALRLRDMTGSGQKIEVAMVDSIFTMLEENVIKTSMEGVAHPGEETWTRSVRPGMLPDQG